MKKSNILLCVFALLCGITAIFLITLRPLQTEDNSDRSLVSKQEISKNAKDYYAAATVWERPKLGVIPDKNTALRVAIAVWEPVYGSNKIRAQAPFKVTLVENVWFVMGSLPKGKVGGVAVAKISKVDGRVLYISHGI